MSTASNYKYIITIVNEWVSEKSISPLHVFAGLVNSYIASENAHFLKFDRKESLRFCPLCSMGLTSRTLIAFTTRCHYSVQQYKT
jgi:hypothetical protein